MQEWEICIRKYAIDCAQYWVRQRNDVHWIEFDFTGILYVAMFLNICTLHNRSHCSIIDYDNVTLQIAACLIYITSEHILLCMEGLKGRAGMQIYCILEKRDKISCILGKIFLSKSATDSIPYI